MKVRVRDLARNVWLKEDESGTHAFSKFYLDFNGNVVGLVGSIEKPEDMQFTDLTWIEYKRPLKITKPEERFVVQHCTGIKDKNGKEVYEGDVIDTWETPKGVVIFQNGAFMVRAPAGGICPDTYFNLTHGFIVGNIFEPAK